MYCLKAEEKVLYMNCFMQMAWSAFERKGLKVNLGETKLWIVRWCVKMVSPCSMKFKCRVCMNQMIEECYVLGGFSSELGRVVKQAF